MAKLVVSLFAAAAIRRNELAPLIPRAEGEPATGSGDTTYAPGLWQFEIDRGTLNFLFETAGKYNLTVSEVVLGLAEGEISIEQV